MNQQAAHASTRLIRDTDFNIEFPVPLSCRHTFCDMQIAVTNTGAGHDIDARFDGIQLFIGRFADAGPLRIEIRKVQASV